MNAQSFSIHPEVNAHGTRIQSATLPEGMARWITPRETQVLELVARGMSAKEIAQRLDMSPRTVDQHIVNLKMKVRARNRAHMITIAMIEGLIDIPSLECSRAA